MSKATELNLAEIVVRIQKHLITKWSVPHEFPDETAPNGGPGMACSSRVRAGGRVDRCQHHGLDAAMTPHPRTRLVNFRVSQDEMERLVAKAAEAEMSVSDYVRTQLLVGREQIGVENRLAALEAAIERMVARRRVA